MQDPQAASESTEWFEQHVPLTAAAARLNITVSTLVQRCHELGVPIVKLGRRTRRITESSLRRLLQGSGS